MFKAKSKTAAKRSLWLIIAMSSLSLSTASFITPIADAGQFRHFDAIKKSHSEPPAGYTRPLQPIRIERRVIEQAIQVVTDHYRKPQLREFLHEKFSNSNGLVDAIQQNMPLDARMRVMGIQGPQVLRQFVKSMPDGSLEILSEASAIVRSQVEFTTAEGGFQRRENASEWILEITTRLINLEEPKS